MRGQAIKGLGEIVLYVDNIGSMTRFYQDTVGLTVMSRFREGKVVESDPCDAIFFQVAEGYGGHTQILGLFDRSVGRTSADSRRERRPALRPETSPLTHIAFEIALEDFGAEKARLGQLGLELSLVDRPWMHWRSLYFDDPEGNRLEFVCYDESL